MFRAWPAGSSMYSGRTPTELEFGRFQYMSMVVMPLKALIRNQDKYTHSSSLPGVLGDGYLYEHSSLFATIRNAALKNGYRFVEQESELWHDYVVMPLLSLKSILVQKSIPYVDNVSVLKKLLKQQPEVELPSRLVYDVVRRNYVFHETCHCIAHELINSDDTVLRHARTEKERFVLEAFLQEAFANTVERLANATPPSKTFAFFMNLNNYMFYRSDKHELWQSAIQGLEPERLFQLVFLCFLNQNLQAAETSVSAQSLIDILWSGDKPPAEHQPLLDTLIEKELVLSPVFREETTRGYFRLYGCDSELTSIRKAELLRNAGFIEDLRMLQSRLYAFTKGPGNLIVEHREAANAVGS